MNSLKIVTWNVNGLRAVVKKGFLDYFHEADADFFCLQEIKLQEGQIELDLEGYEMYWNYAEKKGYSGTAIFTKHTPLSVHYGVGEATSEKEGRIITLEYDNYYVITEYTPNSKRDLSRLEERLEWEDDVRHYLQTLDAKKPVIYCGDLNVANTEIDLKNPKPNRGNSGFTDEERAKHTAFLEAGFTDTFRHIYPDAEGAYTWWSYMNKARDRNIGWRIDYIMMSDRLADRLQAVTIESEVLGSDHCPVTATFDL